VSRAPGFSNEMLQLMTDFTALHLGGLHPYKQALVMVLAFGPMVVLYYVIRVRKREVELEEQRR
jgi:hypothetical protein